MNARGCRRCGTPLSTANARIYQGRWVGACRSCESAEAAERKKAAVVAAREKADAVEFGASL